MNGLIDTSDTVQFRCKDSPWMGEEDMNGNVVSGEFILKGSGGFGEGRCDCVRGLMCGVCLGFYV